MPDDAAISPLPRSRWLALLGGFLLLDTAVQVAFKAASDGLGDQPLGVAWFVMAAASPMVWLAVALYGLTFLLWMLILQVAPLSRAFPLTALTYISVPAAGWILFAERLTMELAVGTVLIVAGVILIGHRGDA